MKKFRGQTLDEISNTRLFRLKQRKLPWQFLTVHTLGRTNDDVDAVSRYSTPGACTEVSSVTANDREEKLLAATLSHETECITSISWELLAIETRKSKILSKVITALSKSFQGDNDGLSEYIRYRNSLYITDGVILYQDMVVMPFILHKAILEKLLSGNHASRAQAIVF